MYGSILILSISQSHQLLHWKHIVGLLILPVNTQLLLKQHKLGVIALGFTILLGMVGLFSYDTYISTTTFFIGKTENATIPVFHGQPIFLASLILHFIISGKYYFGILTKQYWKNILE